MLGPDMRAVIAVEDHADGVFLIGDYANVLHANLASTSGRIFVVTCYSLDLSRTLANSLL
eukprot:6196729-Pleurochrysis_carterae.AAC.1